MRLVPHYALPCPVHQKRHVVHQHVAKATQLGVADWIPGVTKFVFDNSGAIVPAAQHTGRVVGQKFQRVRDKRQAENKAPAQPETAKPEEQ